MLTDFPGFLLFGLPGLIVYLWSVVIRVSAARRGQPSALGIRLAFLGIGLVCSGLSGGVALAALVRSGFLPAALLLIATVWPGLALLWMAVTYGGADRSVPAE